MGNNSSFTVKKLKEMLKLLLRLTSAFLGYLSYPCAREGIRLCFFLKLAINSSYLCNRIV